MCVRQLEVHTQIQCGEKLGNVYIVFKNRDVSCQRDVLVA